MNKEIENLIRKSMARDIEIILLEKYGLDEGQQTLIKRKDILEILKTLYV